MSDFFFFLSDVHNEPEEDPGKLENIEQAVGKFGRDFSLWHHVIIVIITIIIIIIITSAAAAAAAAAALKLSSIIVIVFALFISLLNITRVFYTCLQIRKLD